MQNYVYFAECKLRKLYFHWPTSAASNGVSLLRAAAVAVSVWVCEQATVGQTDVYVILYSV